jgi:hypothetical protein
MAITLGQTEPGGSAPYCDLCMTPSSGLVGQYQRFGGSYYFCIVTCTPIARQRVGKHISAALAYATVEGYPLLGNGPVNMNC